MLKSLKHTLFLLLATWSLVVMPTRAMAYDVLQCDNGQVKAGTELFYDDPGAPPSKPSFCSEVTPQRILSTIICSFVLILNDVLGKMYCGFQYTFQEYVALLITIYIILFGMQILMGTTQLSSKEMLVRFLKIGAVWVFVSEANWGVNMLFVFFIDFANQGIWWTLSAINDGTNFIGEEMDLPDMADGVSGVVPAYIYIDQLIYNAVSGPFTQANSKLIGFFSVLGFASPPIFMIAAYWLWTTFNILARTFIAFLMSLSAIAFLIAMSPIFFCFMLFAATIQFFEIWLKYMISYSLQVLIVFGIIAMWILAMVNFVGFFDQLSNVIFDYKKLEKIHQISTGSQSVGICPYVVSQSGDLIGPNVKCHDPEFAPFEVDADGELTNRGKRDNERLISLSNVSPSMKLDEADNANSACQGVDQTNEGAVQCSLTRLFYYVTYHLITLIIVAYAFDALLKKAPYIAKELSGPQYVPILGQGFGGLGYHPMRGVSKTRDKTNNMDGVGKVVTEVVDSSRRMSQNPRGRPLGG